MSSASTSNIQTGPQDSFMETKLSILGFGVPIKSILTAIKKEPDVKMTMDLFTSYVVFVVRYCSQKEIAPIRAAAERFKKNFLEMVPIEVIATYMGIATSELYTISKEVDDFYNKIRNDSQKKSSATISVTEALMRISISEVGMNIMSENIDLFQSFGSSTSHTLRDTLFKMFEAEKMSSEAIFFVYFFAAMIKNKGRIESALSRAPVSFTGYGPVTEARNFLNKKVVQYTKEESAGSKFAMVHLPTTNPGMDIFCWVSVVKTESRSIGAFVERLTAAQIYLENSLIEECKAAQKNFWLEKIRTTNNDQNKEFVPTFREDFFATAAADRYKLVDMDANGFFFEVEPKSPTTGYSRAEVEEYLASVKFFGEQ